MGTFQCCFPVDEHKQVASSTRSVSPACEMQLVCLSLGCGSQQVPKLDLGNWAARIHVWGLPQGSRHLASLAWQLGLLAVNGSILTPRGHEQR